MFQARESSSFTGSFCPACPENVSVRSIARVIVAARGLEDRAVGAVLADDDHTAGQGVGGLAGDHRDEIDAGAERSVELERRLARIRAVAVGAVINLARADEDVDVRDLLAVRGGPG